MVVASGLLAIIVGGAFAAVLVTITQLRGTTDLRRQTREALVAADTLEKHIIDLETGLRGFVITRDESFLQPSNDARAALPDSARALERLAADEPVQRARVRRIVRAMDAYDRQYALPLVRAVRRDDPSVRSVERTLTGKQRVDALRQGLNSFRTAERARLERRDADVDEAARRATAAAAVGVAGSVVLIIVFSGYLTRVIVRPLRRAAVMANRLAGGDLSARMRETDVAEIGALERSFNVMAGSLETSRDKLASLLAEQAALRRVATLVARGAASAEVFAVTATEVCRLLGTTSTALCRYEPDATGTVVALATDVELGVGVGARLTLEGENAMGTVFRTGRAARVDSFERPTGTLADLARKGGICTSVGAPIVVEGRLWGVVVLSSRGRTLPADTEQRLADFTELVATAIANADGRAQLVASRARVLTAGDDARRRVVRDLHDGAQQRLVHTIVTLKLAQGAAQGAAQDATQDDGESADALVAEALEQAEQANAELRELAHGILPAVLARGGLRAGLDALVSRVRVPVDVDVDGAVAGDRLPAEIEASAYFVVAEALTNVVKHSRARSAEVKAWVEDRALHLDVRDDGVGGARPDGTGLLGLNDRVAALGGRLRVESPPGRGTRIAATLPL
ncbi:CHASE3 domain-containing protein [Baekduia sp.]|uniref:CHASE3 domain-containing protein n=1 Tax=Baekduia sp. TaxID=2600305 RepID=UPI002D1FBB4B|nr:CHASE3 domain-containing protein [Baekduia sp.]